MPKNIKAEVRRVEKALRAMLPAYEGGARLPSYQALMERLGASRRTLERVLAQLEREGLLRRESRIGLFVRREAASAARRIMIVHSDWPAEYWQVLDAKFEEGLQQGGYRLSRVFLDPRERDYGRVLNRDAGDAALLTYAFTHSGQVDVARLLACDIPLVFLENHIACDGLNTIDSEPEYTGMLAADCLLRNGHRAIAVIVSEFPDRCVRRENDGFLRHLEFHGIAPLWIEARSGHRESSLRNTELSVRGHLRRHGLNFSGCFVQGVFSALGVYNAARSLGYAIPEDISIVANSEVPSAALCDPPLTTIARDFDGYVREVREGLDNIFAGKPFGIRRAPSRLIERGSVRKVGGKSG